MTATEPRHERPTPAKKRAGLLVAAGQMLLWNPAADLLQGFISRIIGATTFRISTAVGSIAYYVWKYRQEIDEFKGLVGDELTESVKGISYREERLAIRMAIPDLLSLVRPALGLVAAVLLLRGRAVEALAVYALGIVTDVLDGWLARRLRGGTSWGKDLDGITDSVMNLFAFGAVVVVGIRELEVWFLAAGTALVLLWVGTRLFTHKHSVIAKLRSGITRSVLYVAIAATLPSPWNWAGLALGALMLAVGGSYELGVTRRDLDTGRRPLVGKGWIAEYREGRTGSMRSE